MRAPFFPVPLATATAELPLRFASDFARFTSCEVPNESEAALFSLDMASCVSYVDELRFEVGLVADFLKLW